MKPRQYSFSEARGKLTSILDQVEKTGEPVTILRRGNPAVVVVSHELYEARIRRTRRSWRLAGSLQVRAGVDADSAIRGGRQTGPCPVSRPGQ